MAKTWATTGGKAPVAGTAAARARPAWTLVSIWWRASRRRRLGVVFFAISRAWGKVRPDLRRVDMTTAILTTACFRIRGPRRGSLSWMAWKARLPLAVLRTDAKTQATARTVSRIGR